MLKISNSQELKEAIRELEAKRAVEGLKLKQEFQLAYESIKPANLIKNTFVEITQSEELKENLINTSVAMSVGYISKSLFEKTSHSPLRKLFGTALMFGVTNLLSKNPEVVKTIGVGLLNVIKKVTKPKTHLDSECEIDENDD